MEGASSHSAWLSRYKASSEILLLIASFRLQIFNLFVSVIGVIYIQRVPRRTLWLGSTIAMLVLYSMFTAASAVFDKTGNRNAGRAAVAMIFLYNGAYDLSYSIMYYSYVLEVLPYRMRTKGMALSLAVDYGVSSGLSSPLLSELTA
jgi:hypothetical protein